ncbi:MAG: hypothetical protein MUD05_08760, partial [Candidatus Nanopelagicales bacterium]|nr:hypothetical protein [Candidatus Nanopelagicales bacterium]
PADVATPEGVVRLAAPTTTRDFAVVLYRALRDADAQGLTDLWAIAPADDSALGMAVRDRLTRAATR